MRSLRAADVLALWESGAQRHALDRGALLCAWARPDLPPDTVVDLPLGVVTRELLSLREASFGAAIHSHVDCGACGERLSVALRASEVLQAADDDEAARDIELHGTRLRALSLRDLAAVADELDAAHAARQLLARCAALGEPSTLQDWPDEWVAQAEEALERLDPNADIALDVQCQSCGQHSTAQLDASALLWDEIDARARSLLAEVNVLARAYGWSEAEILALTPTRRGAYLSMVDA
ncbi:hypothetical protein QTI66_08660 [Variovorax sp. J22R133]|uniref:hypothetical protein n=1 Tax=Variovorax brevis TaxID=3053503 RepID=UPI002574A62C|nr:hypothetical protein [Variovorax sp. J22R133]MDM0112219.1 hypothetical protein [Variovorax sp. J22R133]